MTQALAGIIVFEDERWPELAPLSDLLPVPALGYGAGTLASRWSASLGVPLVAVEARPLALACWRERPANVAAYVAGRGLALNAACVPGTGLEAAAAAGQDALFSLEGRVLGASASLESLRAGSGHGERYDAFLRGLGLPEVQVSARVIERPWQMIEWNVAALAADLAALPAGIAGEVHSSAVIEAPERVSIAPGARVDALALIDARDGPVRIEAGVRVAPHTWVKGPCWVGRGTQLLGGLIGRSTIGPDCRIAGEVEDCIWQGYGNKRHHGFVGHSIVGEWVNLGALTTTSDLKNNYGVVRMRLPEGEISTGLKKVGALIGAHVKTGIGTLLTTGSSIGPGANLFGGGRFAPKHVPPFAWWDGEHMEEHRFEPFLATARIALSRRDQTLSGPEAEALRALFARTVSLRSEPRGN